jgi:hypothetical protein
MGSANRDKFFLYWLLVYAGEFLSLPSAAEAALIAAEL